MLGLRLLTQKGLDAYHYPSLIRIFAAENVKIEGYVSDYGYFK